MRNLIKRVAVAAISLGMVLSPIAIGDAAAQNSGKNSGKNQNQNNNQSSSTNQGSGKKKSNTGRNVAAGVAAGIVGAIILNEVARGNSDSRSTYVEDRGERRLSCRQLERRCDDGQDWACRKLDRDC